MKVIQFRVEDLHIIKKIINQPNRYTDLMVEELTELGYIQEIPVEDDYEAMVFAQVYLAHRRGLKHKGLSLITDTNPQWTALKRVSEEALEFIGAMRNAVSMREGFVYYLKLAAEQEWVTLRDLRFRGPKLLVIYEAELTVDQDPNQDITDRLVEAYTREKVKRTGYTPVVKVAGDYLPFISAAVLCIKYKVTPLQYIQHLAEKWEWTGDLKPSQLHGKKAEEYLLDLVAQGGVARPTVVKKVTLKKGADRYG